MENQEQNPSGTELEAKLEQLNRFTRRTLTQEEVFIIKPNQFHMKTAYPHTGGGIPL